MKSAIVYIVGILALTAGLFPFIDYEMISENISSRPVVRHVLEVDPGDPRAEIAHGYSFGLLYGFQKTSEIAEANGAVAAINGMFYDDLGMPIGIIIDQGRPVRVHDAGTPVVLVGENGEVQIKEVSSEAYMYVSDGYVWLYSVNGRVPDGSWGYFQPVFGRTTRIYRTSTNYLIDDGVITEVIHGDTPVSLSTSDGVLTYAGIDDSFSIGDRVSLDVDLGLGAFAVDTAFQAGGWLVRDGQNVAEAEDAFIGYTTAPQPRTLVGVTDEGTLLFVVVDGRQQGYSLGVSGYHAAQIMISHGCTDAAYLDGGASSTMWLDGEVVNQPSGSDERAVAHVILIKENLDLER